MQISTTPNPGALPSPGTLANWEKKAPATGIQYPPLSEVTRPTLDTAGAAFYLNRQPQTLRVWSSLETFPVGLRPLKVNGRLAWPVAGLRQVLGA